MGGAGGVDRRKVQHAPETIVEITHIVINQRSMSTRDLGQTAVNDVSQIAPLIGSKMAAKAEVLNPGVRETGNARRVSSTTLRLALHVSNAAPETAHRLVQTDSLGIGAGTMVSATEATIVAIDIRAMGFVMIMDQMALPKARVTGGMVIGSVIRVKVIILRQKPLAIDVEFLSHDHGL